LFGTLGSLYTLGGPLDLPTLLLHCARPQAEHCHRVLFAQNAGQSSEDNFALNSRHEKLRLLQKCEFTIMQFLWAGLFGQ